MPFQEASHTPSFGGLGLRYKGGGKVDRCGGIVYHRHDEKEPNWEPGGVRSGAMGCRFGQLSESWESTGTPSKKT